MIGIEAGWTDFREDDYSFTTGGVTNRVETDAESYYVAGKMVWPINPQFSAFGKLGLSHNRAEQSGGTIGRNNRAACRPSAATKATRTRMPALARNSS